MKNEKMLTTKQASEIAGVNCDTIRRWENKGLIKSYRTEGGHRRYDSDSLYNYIRQPKVDTPNKHTLIYARVSTRNRENDLNRQIELLEMFCVSHGWKYKTIADIGSGLNYNKKGLLELIELIETNKIDRLVINYKDRLLRFGSEIIFELCKWHNVEVIIVSEDESKTNEMELVDDILSIITVFSAKLYGSKSHRNKSIVETNKEMFKNK
jgi:excisionase family DNA binding protein